MFRFVMTTNMMESSPSNSGRPSERRLARRMYLYESKIVLASVYSGITSAIVAKRSITAFLDSTGSSLRPTLAFQRSMETTQ